MSIIEQARAEGVEGFLHPSELGKLMELADGREVCEVGSYKGLSAWGMAQTASSVTCVDTFKAADDGQRQTTDEDRSGALYTTMEAFLRAVGRFQNVEVFPMTSEQANAEMNGRKFDMVFIDAMHTYAEVKADIERWWPRVKPGGILAGHDYGHGDFPGVKQAFDEVFGPAPEGTTVVTLRWVKK